MRRIDDYFHIENDQIIKTSNGEPILEDEPTFLFRARDKWALLALRYYRELCVADGCNDYHIEGISQMMDKFAAFADRYPWRMKQPGINRGK